MISIIVPAYNAEKVIVKCINSLINQSEKEIEIILVDDGSEDCTYEICTSFEKQDSRIKVIQKENGGVSAARNSGINIAKGEYIMFVDADDYCEKDYCKKMLEYQQDSKSDLVVCGYRRIEKEGYKEIQPNYLEQDSFEKKFCGLLDSGQIYPPWAKLFLRKKILQYFNENKCMGEDLEFNLAYLLNCNSICCVKEILYNYDCTSEMALTKQFDKIVNSLVDTCEVIKSFIDKKNIHYENIDNKYFQKFRLCLYQAMQISGSYNDYKKLFQKLCTQGKFSRVARNVKTKGLLNHLTRWTIKTNVTIFLFIILKFKLMLSAFIR